MGYSARADAYRTYNKWSDACVRQTGSSNTFKVGGETYFYERGREQRDGAITGTVYRFVGESHARRAGTFRINPDGTVARAPKFLKEAA